MSRNSEKWLLLAEDTADRLRRRQSPDMPIASYKQITTLRSLSGSRGTTLR